MDGRKNARGGVVHSSIYELSAEVTSHVTKHPVWRAWLNESLTGPPGGNGSLYLNRRNFLKSKPADHDLLFMLLRTTYEKTLEEKANHGLVLRPVMPTVEFSPNDIGGGVWAHIFFLYSTMFLTPEAFCASMALILPKLFEKKDEMMDGSNWLAADRLIEERGRNPTFIPCWKFSMGERDCSFEWIASLLVSTAKENNMSMYLTGNLATKNRRYNSSAHSVISYMPTICSFAEGFNNMNRQDALPVLIRLLAICSHGGGEGKDSTTKVGKKKFRDDVDKYCNDNDLEVIHWNQYVCNRHCCGQGPDCIEPSHRVVGSIKANKIDEIYHYVLSEGPRDESGELIAPTLTLNGQTFFGMICDQHTQACRANDPNGPVGRIGFPGSIDRTDQNEVLSYLPKKFLEEVEKITMFDKHTALLHSSTEQDNIHNSGSTLSSDNESSSMSQALVTSSEKSDSSTSKKIEPLSMHPRNCSSLTTSSTSMATTGSKKRAGSRAVKRGTKKTSRKHSKYTDEEDSDEDFVKEEEEDSGNE